MVAEDIFTAVVRNNEAETFGVIEPEKVQVVKKIRSARALAI